MELINLMIIMVVINVFAYLTIRLRPVFFKTKLFKPMIWNFKLSLMPIIILLITSLLYLVSMYTYAHTEMILFVYLAYLVFVVGLILQILMLPNSGYLITELNMTHRLDDVVEVPIWYDIISVMSFALSGIINTLVNIVFLQLIFLVVLIQKTSLRRHLSHSSLPQSFSMSWQQLVFTWVVRFDSTLGMYYIQNHFNSSRVLFEFILFVAMHATFFMILYYALGIQRIFI